MIIVLDKNNALNVAKDFGFRKHLKVRQVHVNPVILLVKHVMAGQVFVHLAVINTDWKAHIVFLSTILLSLLNLT